VQEEQLQQVLQEVLPDQFQLFQQLHQPVVVWVDLQVEQIQVLEMEKLVDQEEVPLTGQHHQLVVVQVILLQQVPHKEIMVVV
jgi:hypothetical protein